VPWLRAALAFPAAGVLALAVVSGGSVVDPRTPPALPGMPPPFLGTAAVGNGGLTAAVDAYGDVVDLRAPGPAGVALIDNPVERQAAGSVAPDTGIVARARVGGGPALPLWRADAVSQRYRPGTNVLVTEASLGSASVEVTLAVHGEVLACLTGASGAVRLSIDTEGAAGSLLRCDDERARRVVRAAERSDRRWLSRARGLGAGAPAWASHMYRRSLLVLRALTDGRTGAVAAGARDGWAYVWPRDAAAAGLAFAAAGYSSEARRVARFLRGLDLDAAARFHGDGAPVEGRGAQGDAAGWVAVAARAAGLPPPARPHRWRDRPDYQERDPGAYLGNALAAAAAAAPAAGRGGGPGGDSASHPPGSAAIAAFATSRGLLRRAGDPASGLDSAAAWAVRPFARPALYPAARRTLLGLTQDGTRFGIAPGEDWDGADPWSAPTAWTAWSLAALGERRRALRLMAALRRASTPAGALPERVDAGTGLAVSTTPLAWSHAFAILVLRELWP
jgi:hypothetical protein